MASWGERGGEGHKSVHALLWFVRWNWLKAQFNGLVQVYAHLSGGV